MLYLAQLKEKLLKKYSKESGFYELSLPTSYPYVVSLNSPSSKELLNELPKVRAWQQEYESSKLAPFLIYQEHKARGALGDHRVLAQVCFPDCHTLEHFIAPKNCPQPSSYAVSTNKDNAVGAQGFKIVPERSVGANSPALGKSQIADRNKLGSATNGSIKQKALVGQDHKKSRQESVAVPSLMEQLGLADCFAQYAQENDIDLAKSNVASVEPQPKSVKPAVSFSSLSDQDFFSALDRASAQTEVKAEPKTLEPNTERQGKLLPEPGYSIGKEVVSNSLVQQSCGSGGCCSGSTNYLVANEVLAGLDKVNLVKGPLKEHERKIKAPYGSFRCFQLQLSRIQAPLYPNLGSNQAKLSLRNQGLNEYIKTHARSIAQIGADFWVIVQLVDYLASLKRTPNIYVRQVSLPLMDTKFIERNYRMIDELLILCLPKERDLQEYEPLESDKQGYKKSRSFSDFVKRWGFANKKEMIRWRMLDPKMSSSLYEGAGSMIDSIVPIDVLAHLKLNFEHVIICENEVCYLNLPAITNSIAIFGSGYKVGLLSELPWLKDKDIIYWGDIDTHGFNILNSFREALNYSFKDSHYDASLKVRTMLMDIDTLKSNKHYIVQESESVSTFLATLKGKEYLCYEALINHSMGKQVRLEQELIPFDQVLAALKAILPKEKIIFNYQLFSRSNLVS